MSDKPPANPDDLTAAAKRFYAAAEELQRIHAVLTNRTQDLVSGADAWVGSASEQFQSAWERFGADTLDSATTLERTANVLNALAVAIQNVQASPAGKLVHAIDSGHVKVVPNAVHILAVRAGINIVHASEAASASTTVSDGYEQAAVNGASGFDSAAHATSSAHLAGGVSSTAVGISQAGWSAALQAAIGQSATATDTGKRAGQNEQGDGAPLAPGFFTSSSGGDDASGRAYIASDDDASGAAYFASNGDASDDGASVFGATASSTQDGKTDEQTAKRRTRTRADLGSSPSGGALAAARGQGGTSAWA